MNRRGLFGHLLGWGLCLLGMGSTPKDKRDEGKTTPRGSPLLLPSTGENPFVPPLLREFGMVLVGWREGNLVVQASQPPFGIDQEAMTKLHNTIDRNVEAMDEEGRKWWVRPWFVRTKGQTGEVYWEAGVTQQSPKNGDEPFYRSDITPMMQSFALTKNEVRRAMGS